MQQVFDLANAWLQHDKHALQRRLHVYTYKIVPLAPQSGVLEWCTGTMPLSQYLVRGEKSAHHRLFPNKLSNSDCRQAMARVADKTIDLKLKAFQHVCAGFPPAMRSVLSVRSVRPCCTFSHFILMEGFSFSNTSIHRLSGLKKGSPTHGQYRLGPLSDMFLVLVIDILPTY